MARLGSSSQLGNVSTSSLVKSAASIQTQLANYQDQIQALTYANSAYTDDAFQTYQNYLQGRIKQLQSTGTVTNMSKALTLTKTMESAMHSNISASITRENIQIMAGNAALPDKYNLIVNQYQRAMNNGDFTLAQTLQNQAYSVSQQIQYQAQQAANAAYTLGKAGSSFGGSGSSSSSSSATYQGELASNLEGFLRGMNGTAKNLSERQLNDYATKYVQANKDSLNALGVHIDTQQPNYWDLVYGVAGAAYNAKVLQAQAEAATNPLLSRTYMQDAQNMLTGAHKFSTLAGDLTVQEIQQAQQDPSMMIYNNTKGTYEKSAVIGYQYINMDNGQGGQSPQLVPTYSGQTAAVSNTVHFLTPQEASMATKLGLSFADGKYKQGSYAGDGAYMQASENTPGWLQKIIGQNGLIQVYSDSNGFLTFKAGGSNNQGESYYTLAMDNKGLGGLYEHTADGTSHLVGGDYGFAANAVDMLVNRGQQVQYQVQLAQQKAAAAQALQVQQAQAQAQLQAQQAQAQAQAQMRARTAAAQPAPPILHQALQRTFNPQVPTYNPQPATFNPQPATFNPQGGAGQYTQNVQGVPLHATGGPTIRLS